MAHDLSALKAAIKLVADAAKDSLSLVKAGGGEGSVLGAVLAYENLFPDLMHLVPQIGDLPSEVGAIDAADMLSLTEELVAELGLSSGHVGEVIGAALAVLNHIVHDVLPVLGQILPAIEHLIGAVKGPAAA